MGDRLATINAGRGGCCAPIRGWSWVPI